LLPLGTPPCFDWPCWLPCPGLEGRSLVVTLCCSVPSCVFLTRPNHQPHTLHTSAPYALAVAILSSWNRWGSAGDGVDRGKFYQGPEQALTTFSHVSRGDGG